MGWGVGRRQRDAGCRMSTTSVVVVVMEMMMAMMKMEILHNSRYRGG